MCLWQTMPRRTWATGNRASKSLSTRTLSSRTKTPVMLFVPESDRYVLSASRVKICTAISSSCNRNRQIDRIADRRKTCSQYFSQRHHDQRRPALRSDTKQLVVPPVQQFLTVDVKSDREQYQPREEGTLRSPRKTQTAIRSPRKLLSG